MFQRRYDIKRPTNHLDIVDFYVGTMAECQKYEKEILNQYNNYSIGGDWFNFSEEIVNEILNKWFLKNGRFSKKANGF